VRRMGPGRVAVSAADVQAFADRWPCSGLRDLRGVTFEYDRAGNLVDITFRNGDIEQWDGSALTALSHDAQALAWSTSK
jgi:YD repeat-containing protein